MLGPRLARSPKVRQTYSQDFDDSLSDLIDHPDRGWDYCDHWTKLVEWNGSVEMTPTAEN